MIRIGLKVALADISESNLQKVAKEIADFIGESNTLVIRTDVSKIEQVVALRDKVYEQWGEVRLSASSVLFAMFGKDPNTTMCRWQFC